jgi:glucokinase
VEPAVLAIDIGGTKLALGLVSAEGRILQREEIPTRAAEGPERVLARLEELARSMRDRAAPSYTLRRVGVACAGPLDREAGLILNPPNLPGWTRINLVEQLERALDLPVILDNDANAAALGEFRYGAGQGAQSLVYLTVSTGIGGGIILDGRLWHGFGDSAGEIGHMTIDPAGPACGCGNRGCLEALASGPAIARQAREALRRGRPSRLRDLPEATAADVVRLAGEGDTLAGEVWAASVQALALGVGAAITILAPERVIIGGGVAQAGDTLFVPLRREVRQRVKLVAVESVPILPAALGRDVGILGAAALALEAEGAAAPGPRRRFLS